MIPFGNYGEKCQGLIISTKEYVDFNKYMIIKNYKIKKIFLRYNKEWQWYQSQYRHLCKQEEKQTKGSLITGCLPIQQHISYLVEPPQSCEWKHGMQIRQYNKQNRKLNFSQISNSHCALELFLTQEKTVKTNLFTIAFSPSMLKMFAAFIPNVSISKSC